MVKNETVESVEGVEAVESARRESVSQEAFQAAFFDEAGKPRDLSTLTANQVADSLNMSLTSFRTRFSNFRKIAKGLGLNVPQMKDGRGATKGQKRVTEDSVTRGLKALVAANSAK